MTIQDWHAHAERVDPLVPASTPTLRLVRPTSLEMSAPALSDSTDSALGARVADEIFVLTRVLLGAGASAVEPVEPVEPEPVEPEPVEPEPIERVEPGRPPAGPRSPVELAPVVALCSPSPNSSLWVAEASVPESRPTPAPEPVGIEARPVLRHAAALAIPIDLIDPEPAPDTATGDEAHVGPEFHTNPGPEGLTPRRGDLLSELAFLDG